MSDSLLLEDERRIEEREQKATPGPWMQSLTTPVYAIRQSDAVVIASVSNDPDDDTEYFGDSRSQAGENIRFIAHARTDIPLLLSRLKAEREKNEKLMLGLDSALRDLDFDSPHKAKRTSNELLRAAAKESHVTESH